MRTCLRLLPVVALLALSACDSVKDTLGFEHQTPDEFAVAVSPPLSIPPDYTLRPPAPGTAPRGAVEASAQAQTTLLGNGAANRAATPASVSNGVSGGEAALLQQAGSVPQAQATAAATNPAGTDSIADAEHGRIETALFDTPASGADAPQISMREKGLFSWF